MRVLADAINLAQEARLASARLLAARGVQAAPSYPDVSTRTKAAAVAEAFVAGKGPRLIP